jgi:hypothetical protein
VVNALDKRLTGRIAPDRVLEVLEAAAKRSQREDARCNRRRHPGPRHLAREFRRKVMKA